MGTLKWAPQDGHLGNGNKGTSKPGQITQDVHLRMGIPKWGPTDGHLGTGTPGWAQLGTTRMRCEQGETGNKRPGMWARLGLKPSEGGEAEQGVTSEV